MPSGGKVSDEALTRAVGKAFDFRPAAIIDTLDLRRPIYEPFSCYGHFGRLDLSPTWERTDRVQALTKAL